MDAELMSLFEKQLAFEKKHANALKPFIDSTENSIVRMFLSKIMLETTKHATMFQAMIDLDAGKVVWHIDKERMIEQLNYHLQTEVQMLEGIQKIVGKIEEKRTKDFLGEILADERRHHEILKNMIDFFESIDVKEEDWLALYRTRLQGEWPGF